VSAQLTWRVLDETSGAGMAANRPAFSLKLPRWSCNLRQRAYNCRELVFNMEIPVENWFIENGYAEKNLRSGGIA
jgi:hypothetical protein